MEMIIGYTLRINDTSPRMGCVARGAPAAYRVLLCGGDGGWDDTYIDRSHSVRSDWYDCRACGGTGYIEARILQV